MKPGFASRSRQIAGAVLLLCAATMTAFCAEPSQPGSAAVGLITIPAPPVLPHSHDLSDEFDGRHLFFDTRFAYQRPMAITFDAQWVTASGSPGDVQPPSRSGSEKLSSEVNARRLSLASENDNRNGGRTIVRTIADGASLISTRFDQASATTTAPTRTYIRLTLDESASLQRSLAQVQVRPETRGGELALTQVGDVLPAAAILWRGGEETLAGGARGVVVNEFDNRAGTTGDGVHGSQERFCRYLIDPDTHRLLRFESWDIDSSRPRPERKYKPKDANGAVAGQTIDVPASPSTIYRRESYEHVALSTTKLNPSLWALTVPDSYKEGPLPATNLPPLPAPPADGAFDEHALALLRLWRDAGQRFLTLSSSVDVLQHFEQRTEISRSPGTRFADSNVHYEVTIQRPGRAHVTMHAITGGAGGRRNDAREGIAAVDGQEAVAVVDGVRNKRPFRDPAPLYSYILQAGLRDPYNALFYLFNPAPDTQYYDRITYDGPQPLDGQSVDIITLHRTILPVGQLSKAQVTIRCFLGKDGMPREIETRSENELNARLLRDQPPVNIRTVHYKNLLLDSTPTTPFTLP